MTGNTGLSLPLTCSALCLPGVSHTLHDAPLHRDNTGSYHCYRTTPSTWRKSGSPAPEVWQSRPPDATEEMRTTRTAKWKLGIIWSSPTLLVGDAENSMKFSSAFICKQPYQDTGLAKQTPKKCTFSVCFRERRSIFILRLCPFSRNGLTDRHAWLSPWHLCTTTWWQVFYLFLKFDIYL